ncbi:MAG: maleylpyruvate isomerase N-terminal domain-containing protein [Dehalococcoidia bacterium]|jgi:hypothetical protein
MVESRVAAVIERANTNRSIYEAFCRSLPQDELQAPVPGTPWRVQDYVAHLASIDIYVADWFEHAGRKERFRAANPDGTPFDIDVWNQAMVDDRAAATLEELLAEAAVHRERLWRAVAAMPDDVLWASFNFRGNDTSYVRYLELWTAHDPAHTVDMLRGLPPGRREPVDSWLREHRM